MQSRIFLIAISLSIFYFILTKFNQAKEGYCKQFHLNRKKKVDLVGVEANCKFKMIFL